VQEAHIFCGHVLCDIVESSMHGQELASEDLESLAITGVLTAEVGERSGH
jgi:hypothetical protein